MEREQRLDAASIGEAVRTLTLHNSRDVYSTHLVDSDGYLFNLGQYSPDDEWERVGGITLNLVEAEELVEALNHMIAMRKMDLARGDAKPD